MSHIPAALPPRAQWSRFKPLGVGRSVGRFGGGYGFSVGVMSAGLIVAPFSMTVMRNFPLRVVNWLGSAVAVAVAGFAIWFLAEALMTAPASVRSGDIRDALGFVLIAAACTAIFSAAVGLWLASRPSPPATVTLLRRVFLIAGGLTAALMLAIVAITATR